MHRLPRFALLWLSLLLTPNVLAQDLTDLVRQVRPGVVLLEVYDHRDEMVSTGSGFFVDSSGLIMTNYHVIEDGYRVRARLAEGELADITGVLAEDRKNDLAVLQAVPGAYTPLRLAGSSPDEAGQQVVVLGGPRGLASTLSQGLLSAIRQPDDPAFESQSTKPEGPVLQITAAVAPGSSGSPVFNLEGDVIGVVVSQYLLSQGLNFAIPIEPVHDLLNGIDPNSPARSFRQAPLLGGGYLANLGLSAAFFLLLGLGLKRAGIL